MSLVKVVDSVVDVARTFKHFTNLITALLKQGDGKKKASELKQALSQLDREPPQT
jgi:hypothetical protein